MHEQAPIIIPPYNGIGDEVDTLGYIYKLIPDKPKGDFFKSVDNDKKILRYTAKFNTRVPEDFDRRFIISFYLSDDSISIYEPAQKNSGIMEGKFLERRKYKNVDKGGEFITPTDMPLGGNIKINGHSFNILSCDEYTKNYLNEHLFWALIASWATPHLQATMDPHLKNVSVSEFAKSYLSATSNAKKLILKLPQINPTSINKLIINQSIFAI